MQLPVVIDEILCSIKHGLSRHQNERQKASAIMSGDFDEGLVGTLNTNALAAQ